MKHLLEDIIKTILQAGDIVTKIYHTAFDVNTKSDNTPVTLADTLSSQYIINALKKHQLPILSEEEITFNPSEQPTTSTYFIVDPLDGTREFIKRNGEFTINIALIEHKEPVLGVVYAPALSLLYFGLNHFGAYKIANTHLHKLALHPEYTLDEILALADKLPVYNLPKVYTILTSRSHLDEKTIQYINNKRKEHGLIEYIRIGSSLKICLLAEGKAHEYPRFGKTMEWDTAAPHIILQEAGGNILDLKHLQPLKYHKTNFENPDFIAYAVY